MNSVGSEGFLIKDFLLTSLEFNLEMRILSGVYGRVSGIRDCFRYIPKYLLCRVNVHKLHKNKCSTYIRIHAIS